ncbi:hypothetical protein WA026_005290 [Henosepilachna vigintioctopunctata]|uniref:Uncharacterized protein n=1 Tax=Henosepilachna vigintioctopunctata TaxID=420089 RepID=A0AAW1UTH3_9CUCU
MNNLKAECSSSFQRNVITTSSSSSTHSKTSETCRRKLNYKNKENSNTESEDSRAEKSVLSVISLNDTRRFLRSGAERLGKTLNNVRTTIGSFTQIFKISTKRRQILEEGPMTPECATPHTMSKQVLGRTPTKLYSPFSFESPYQPTTYDKENIPVQQKQVTMKKVTT